MVKFGPNIQFKKYYNIQDDESINHNEQAVIFHSPFNPDCGI